MLVMSITTRLARYVALCSIGKLDQARLYPYAVSSATLCFHARGRPRRAAPTVVGNHVTSWNAPALRGRPSLVSSSSKRQDDAESHLAAMHLLVSLGHPLERVLLDHRVHVGQRAQFKGVL